MFKNKKILVIGKNGCGSNEFIQQIKQDDAIFLNDAIYPSELVDLSNNFDINTNKQVICYIQHPFKMLNFDTIFDYCIVFYSEHKTIYNKIVNCYSFDDSILNKLNSLSIQNSYIIIDNKTATVIENI